MARASDIDKFKGGIDKHPVTYYTQNVFGEVVKENRRVRHGNATSATYAANDNMYIWRTYDAIGNLLRVTDGVNSSVAYAGVNSASSSTHKDARVAQTAGATSYKYDVAGKVIAEYTYSRSNPSKYLSEKGYAYNRLGQQVASAVVSETSPTNATKRYAVEQADYNVFGEIIRKKRLDLNTATEWKNYVNNYNSRSYASTLLAKYEYNALGKVSSSQDSNGSATYTYNLAGNLTAKKEYGVTTTYEYDLLERVTKQKLPAFYGKSGSSYSSLLKPEINLQYDRWGNVTKKTDEAGYSTYYEYDHDNRMIEERLPRALLYAVGGGTYYSTTKKYYRYDLLGNLVQQREAAVNGSTFKWLSTRTKTYDRSGTLLLSESDSTGVKLQYRYDAMGNRVATKNNLGTVLLDEYDYRGNKIQQSILRRYGNAAYNSNAHTASTAKKTVLKSYQYDAVGQLLKETTYRDTFTHSGSVISSVGSKLGAVTKTYRYDMLGNVIKRVNESGATETIEFDKFNRKTYHKQAYQNDYQRDYWNYKDTNYFADSISTQRVGYQTTTMSYDSYGRVKQESNGYGHKRTYSYASGRLKQVEESYTIGTRYATGWYEQDVDEEFDDMDNLAPYKYELNRGTYVYDIRGNRVKESTYRVKKEDVYKYYQEDEEFNNVIVVSRKDSAPVTQTQYNAFDEHGRLKQVKKGILAYLNYYYDEQGNRVKIVAKENTSVKTKYNSFDSEGRVIVSDGVVKNGKVVIGSSGRRFAYNSTGQRVSQLTWSYSEDANHGDYDDEPDFESQEVYRKERISYTDLGNVSKIESRSEYGNFEETEHDIHSYGTYGIRTTNTHNLRGDLTRQVTSGNRVTTTKYFADGRVNTQNGYQYKSSYTYNSAGIMTKHVYESTGSTKYKNTYYYSNSYKGGRYQQTYISVSTSLDGYGGGTTRMTFDKFGRLSRTEVSGSTSAKNVYTDFIHNVDGQIVQKNVRKKWGSSWATRSQYYAYLNGATVAGYGNATTDFYDSGVKPVSSKYPAPTGSSYTVSPGDTLSSIAQSVFGDASLWYILASNNNISAGPEDNIGSSHSGITLSIPNVVSSIKNNASTFKPYNPDSIIGDLTPSADAPAPPKQGKQCSGILKVIAIVIVVIVAVVVTVYTAGAAAGAMAAAAPSLLTAGATTGTLVAAAGAGAGATLLAVGATMTAAAIGGFVGSIASQAVAKLFTLRDDISLSEAGASALSGALTAGAGSFLGGGKAVASSAMTAKAARASTNAAKGAIGYLSSYAANRIVGNDTEFRWSGIAIGAIGSVASAGVSQGLSNVASDSPSLIGDVLRSTASNMASSFIRSELNHLLHDDPRTGFDDMFADAFGNAIGGAINARIESGKARRAWGKEEGYTNKEDLKTAYAMYERNRAENVSDAEARALVKAAFDASQRGGFKGDEALNYAAWGMRARGATEEQIIQGFNEAGIHGSFEDGVFTSGLSPDEQKVFNRLADLREVGGTSYSLQVVADELLGNNVSQEAIDKIYASQGFIKQEGVYWNTLDEVKVASGPLPALSATGKVIQNWGDTFESIGNMAMNVGAAIENNPALKYGLMALEFASGPVAFVAREAFAASPLGKAFERAQQSLMTKAVGWVNEEGQLDNIAKAGKMVAGVALAVGLAIGGRKVFTSGYKVLKNMLSADGLKKLRHTFRKADIEAGVSNADFSRPANAFSKVPIEWRATRSKGTNYNYKIHQRNDIDFDQIRTAGDKRFIGKTNAEAMAKGLSPQLSDGNFATLHHLGQKAPGPLVEASTRYHGVGKYGQDVLHSQFGRSKPHPTLQPDRAKFNVDTREYWKWRVNNRGGN